MRSRQNHGLSEHPLYRIWGAIKDRCFNKNVKDYKDYGGRGISVCDGWVNNFQSFYDWAISNGYRRGLEIDRENNDGNYEPSNCRFVIHATNMRNRRTTKLNWDLVRGIKLCWRAGLIQRDIGELYGVTQGTISRVINKVRWG